MPQSTTVSLANIAQRRLQAPEQIGESTHGEQDPLQGVASSLSQNKTQQNKKTALTLVTMMGV